MTILPVIATKYFFDKSLTTTLNLGFSYKVSDALNNSADNLKRLKKLDAVNEKHYREQFDQVQGVLQVYNEPSVIKEKIEASIKVYFWLGLVLVLGLALLLGLYISRKINNHYELIFSNLLKEQKKVSYLEEISSWQELAKMLAHEIKNPLTPIDILVSSLKKSYESRSPSDFSNQLDKTQIMVSEELNHLKEIVNKFSEFSKLPTVRLEAVHIKDYLVKIIEPILATYTDANVELQLDQNISERVMLDPALFRQVISNLIKNGVEANPGEQVSFHVQVQSMEGCDSLVLLVSNEGLSISKDVVKKMFDPYISSKTTKSNMGLGLAIVKKIVVQQGGYIEFKNTNYGPEFSIGLIKAENELSRR
jgi:signal transduction histidine kinase